MKASIKTYRNINGIHFKHETSDPNEFEQLKKECRRLGFKFRIINESFYKQTL